MSDTISETPVEDVQEISCQVEWHMPAHGSDERYFPASNVFEEGQALAVLLAHEVVFLNDHWWQKDWSKWAQSLTSLNVNCNDVFASACADAEEMPYREIENVYRMWKMDSEWGPAVWAMIRRNKMPQRRLEDMIRKAGIWNFEKLPIGETRADENVKDFFAQLRFPGAENNTKQHVESQLSTAKE